MATNKDLISTAEALASELGQDKPETEGLKNADLVKLVSELEATKAEAKVETETEAEKPRYTVAMGKSIITKRGILADGVEITEKDFANGKLTLNDFVDSGYIEKNK